MEALQFKICWMEFQGYFGEFILTNVNIPSCKDFDC